MLIVFATIVVEPNQRDKILSDMNARLEEALPTRHGAIEFRLLLSATEPGTINVFQTWPDYESFQEWGKVPIHLEFQAHFARVAKSLSSVRYLAEPLAPHA